MNFKDLDILEQNTRDIKTMITIATDYIDKIDDLTDLKAKGYMFFNSCDQLYFLLNELQKRINSTDKIIQRTVENGCNN